MPSVQEPFSVCLRQRKLLPLGGGGSSLTGSLVGPRVYDLRVRPEEPLVDPKLPAQGDE